MTVETAIAADPEAPAPTQSAIQQVHTIARACQSRPLPIPTLAQRQNHLPSLDKAAEASAEGTGWAGAGSVLFTRYLVPRAHEAWGS